MATNTQSKRGSDKTDHRGDSARTQPRDSEGQFTETGSAFRWPGGQTGIIVGAAVAGAAVGIAANMGRKLFVQVASTGGVSWDEALATEHRMTLLTFDKIEATSDEQTTLRSSLLAKLKYQLTKHALEEENVIYPALRQANSAHDADALEGEHGYVKTFIYELNQMGTDAPNWLEKVREFKALVQKHARMEEEEVFPRFKQALSEEQNAKITSLVNRDGFWQA